jgi:hypothetical protein
MITEDRREAIKTPTVISYTVFSFQIRNVFPAVIQQYEGWAAN